MTTIATEVSVPHLTVHRCNPKMLNQLLVDQGFPSFSIERRPWTYNVNVSLPSRGASAANV